MLDIETLLKGVQGIDQQMDNLHSSYDSQEDSSLELLNLSSSEDRDFDIRSHLSELSSSSLFFDETPESHTGLFFQSDFLDFNPLHQTYREKCSSLKEYSHSARANNYDSYTKKDTPNNSTNHMNSLKKIFPQIIEYLIKAYSNALSPLLLKSKQITQLNFHDKLEPSMVRNYQETLDLISGISN